MTYLTFLSYLEEIYSTWIQINCYTLTLEVKYHYEHVLCLLLLKSTSFMIRSQVEEIDPNQIKSVKQIEQDHFDCPFMTQFNLV